jgi:hypothetical protein
MYVINNTANLIIDYINGDKATFANEAETKKNILLAWAYFWKGYAYSRIGSMYISGIVADVYGETNNNYLAQDKIITEANKNLDLAIAKLNLLSANSVYSTFVGRLLPTMCRSNGNVPSPDEWKRNINSLKARNILVNKKAETITSSEWQSILSLANDGIKADDFIFVVIPDSRVVSTACVPSRVVLGWNFVTPRLIQDFKDTTLDSRYQRYFQVSAAPAVNESGRGIQFGTLWEFKDNTSIATSAPGDEDVFVYVGPSYEENELMKAEANIYLNNIDAGLSSIDAVRDFQESTLTHVSGTGLSLAQAKKELMQERRIGLLLRGLTFYDARRWNFLTPVANGGGRKGCWVLDADGNLNTNATFDYNYVDYFPIPLNELDFNEPSSSSDKVTIK